MIVDTSMTTGDVALEADVCIVGSGAGGSVVAAELAGAGKTVIVLEEGHYWTSAEFTQREEEMYPRLYRERGTKPTADYTVLVSQGRAVGGSTLTSFCLAFALRIKSLPTGRSDSGWQSFRMNRCSLTSNEWSR